MIFSPFSFNFSTIGATVDEPSPFAEPLRSLPLPEPPLLPPQAPSKNEAPNTVVPTNCHFSLIHPPNINNPNVICISYSFMIPFC